MLQASIAAETIFGKAISIPKAGEREAYLDEACAGDTQLRGEVELLVQHHFRAGDFLEQPALVLETSPPLAVERAGTVIGPYKLMEEIGTGGFGLVFVAEQQQPLRRKVALKVIKPGMDTREVTARFEAERQALALMDHPNIARVFDGGTTPSGRPFFVMELVKGVPVTEFCDQNQLPVRERLELFINVCQAIQHAHQKGVIHRDLKPSNVMVSMHDAVPVVKVIDFGIAKAVGQQLTDKTVYTGFSRMIGTPVYMSPEQAGMSGLDIDTRTDIYALGVLLYELLTGTTPFDKERLKSVGLDELRRIIREEEPETVSQRLERTRKSELGTWNNTSAAPRSALRTPRCHELDWIVMMALEKDRNRRYESASSFAADVNRYLGDEPVQACPPSAWYRFRKFARRNKGMLATAGTIAAALMLAVASLVGAVSVLADSNTEIKKEQKQTQNALDGEKIANDKLQKVLKSERRNLYLKSIALAERELAAKNIGRLEEILDDCPHDLRGWEWHYLRHGRGPLTFEGHGSWVFGVAFSPDGKHVASASKSGEVKVWQRATGKEVHQLLGHEAPAFAVAFHPGGKQLASAGWDHTVRIWDLETGKQVSSLTDHREYVTSVAYSPDGKLLASAGGDNLIMIWDAVTFEKLRTLHGRTRTGYHLAFAPDSRRLAAAAYGEALTLWDATSGQEIYAIPGELFQRVVFSRDGRTLASAEWDGRVRFWDADSGQYRWTLQVDPAIVGIALSPDGQRLATGGFERPVHIWDLETRQEALVLRGHTEMIHELAFSPDGQQLASASWDGTVKVWDASTAPKRSEAESLTLRGFPAGVMGVAFHPDNQRLATASFETVQLWNTTTGAELTALRGHTGIAAGVVFSRDGRTLAAATIGGLIKTWDVENAKEGRTFRGSRTVALSPDGQRVAAVVKAGEVHIWNTTSGAEEIPPFRGHPAPVHSIVFSPDGQQLATGCSDATAIVWNAITGKSLHTLRGHSHAVMHVAFSADGRCLATASLDKTAKVWDAATGQELLTLSGHDDRVMGIAFSPDGKLIATASWDNTAKVWDAATGKEIETLRGHSGYVFSVAFSPDGQRLASAGGYRTRGEVKIWDTTAWREKLDK